MLHDHAGEQHVVDAEWADDRDGDARRLFSGPPGIPLDAFWALVDPEREAPREE